MTETTHPCPVCRTPCRVVGGEDEPGAGGTRHYEPDTTERDELAAALRLLAGSTLYKSRRGMPVCAYCEGRDHADDCRWLRAARVLARYDAKEARP